MEKEPKPVLRILSIVGTFLFVNFGWVLFRSNTITEAARFGWHMIRFWIPSSYSVFADATVSKANGLFVLALVMVAVLVGLKFLLERKDKWMGKNKHYQFVETSSLFSLTVVFVSVSIFVFMFLNSVGGSESAFIYFDF